MGHNFTQPEEIDHILEAMVSRDIRNDLPPQDGHHASGAIQNMKRNEDAEFSGGAGQAKLTHGYCGSNPYVWSM